MHIHAFGADFYLDEEAFKRRMAEPAPPYNIEELPAIQQHIITVDELILRHVQRTATPDPVETLRKHLNEMLETADGMDSH